MAKRVLVGMSGGVDSSVSALLLLRQGYEVEGATFLLWDSPAARDNIVQARATCAKLGIAHHELDLRESFRRDVTEPFAQGYLRGETPNPCVLCNRAIKFPAFWDWAKAHGFDYIATGHYCRLERRDGLFCLRRAANAAKDQSYFLYSLTQELLAHVLFPLGEYESKEEIRALAAEANLAAAHKAESQDICFVPGGDYAAFLEDFLRMPARPGNFIDAAGKVLGRHRGIWHYTIGQRKGLGVSLGHPAFVTAISPGDNTVTLGGEQELLATELLAGQFNWILPPVRRASVKIRYAHCGADAEIQMLDEQTVRIVFDRAQRAATKGQSAVLYNGDDVLGGGIIL